MLGESRLRLFRDRLQGSITSLSKLQKKLFTLRFLSMNECTIYRQSLAILGDVGNSAQKLAETAPSPIFA